MRFLLLFFILGSLASAGDLPWMGVVLEDATKEERAAVGLIGQVGLKVSAITVDGPCARSMAEQGDLWWKFDGQILVSRCQIFVLLRSKKAGDEIPVEFYRAGRLQTMQLILADRPGEKMFSEGSLGRHSERARTLRTRREKVARLSEKGVDFSLQRDNGEFHFQVREGEKVVFSGVIQEADLREKVPSKWLGNYLLLKLTLERHASVSESPEHRRVRYVPRNQGSKE